MESYPGSATHRVPERPSGPRRRRVLIWSCAGCAGAVVIGLIAVLVWTGRFVGVALGDVAGAARSLPAELAAARAEGVPLTGEDLRPKPPVPPDRNAAPVLRQVSVLFQALPADARSVSGEMQKALRSPARTDANREAARALLNERREMLALAAKASALPECDFDRPFERGPEVEFPEMPAIRECARLRASQAILESDAGNPGRAFECLADCGRWARHAASDPVVIAMLVQMAVEAIADASFTQIVLERISDPATVRAARAGLEAYGPLPDLAYGCRGEVVIGRACVGIVRKERSLEAVVGETPAPNVAHRFRDPRMWKLMCDAWEARIVAFWRRAFAAFRARPGDYRAQGAALRQLDDETQRMDRKVSYIMLAILSPVFAHVADKIAQTDARRSLREGLVRIAEYRMRAGRFPASLAEAGGQTLFDPFSGKPLIYRRTDKGFVLYSVGEDRKDDGGKAMRPAPGKPVPDLVIEYPRRWVP